MAGPPLKSFLGGPIFLPSFTSALISLAPIPGSSHIVWERWRVLEFLRWVVMLLLCFGAWIVRSLLSSVPNRIPAPGFLESLSQGSFLLSGNEDDGACIVPLRLSDSAVGRALSQVLALVNEIPVSSDKYEFARTLADKIIQQNITEGGLTSQEVNRLVLAAGFSRTLKLLTYALEGLHQQHEVEAYSWPWRLIRMLPLGGLGVSPQLLSLDNLRRRLCNMVLPPSRTVDFPVELVSSKLAVCAEGAAVSIVAEKLAQELLWMAQKMKDCSAVEEAIILWSISPSLARHSLSAHPRVQGSLLRVSVLIFKELESGELKASRELKFKLLLLWLPLFCCASNGYDTPIFTHAEKVEVVGVLERNIMSLAYLEQEMVLGTWLQEYILSNSDWPNLQRCFENWCDASREFEHQTTKRITESEYGN